MHRRHFIATGLCALALPQGAVAQAAGFQNWIAGFRGRARSAGISDRTFNAAFANISYLPDSIERDRNQSEFVRPLADYMSTAVSDSRVSNGRAAAACPAQRRSEGERCCRLRPGISSGSQSHDQGRRRRDYEHGGVTVQERARHR